MTVPRYGRMPVREVFKRFKSLYVHLHMPRRKSQDAAARRQQPTPRDGEGRRDHAGCTGMVAVDVLIGSEVVERARASLIKRHLGWDGADHRRRMVICS